MNVGIGNEHAQIYFWDYLHKSDFWYNALSLKLFNIKDQSTYQLEIIFCHLK